MFKLLFPKGDRDLNTRPGSESTSLCPIPRSGLTQTTGIILHLFLTLATALVGIGICAMRTISQVEVNIAEAASAVILLLLVVYLWRVTRTAKGIVPILIFAGVFLAYLTNSLIPTAVLFGLIFSVSLGSTLLAVQPKKNLLWFPVIALAAYAITLAVSRDPVGSVAMLIPFPPAVVLALGTRSSAEKQDGLTRVGVICATSLALGLSLGAMILLSAYRHLGTLEPAALTEALEAFRLSLIDQIVSTEIPTEGLTPEALEEFKSLFSYSSVSNMVNGIFNTLPAMAVVAVNLIAATVQLIQHAALRTFGFGESITPRVKIYRMSLISCIVFTVAYLVALLEGSDTSTLTGTVAQNIYIILLPGLALAGMLRITGSLARKGPRGMGCLFFVVILIPCLLLFVPLVFAGFEVIGHIFASLTSAIKPPDDDDPFGRPPTSKD